MANGAIRRQQPTIADILLGPGTRAPGQLLNMPPGEAAARIGALVPEISPEALPQTGPAGMDLSGLRDRPLIPDALAASAARAGEFFSPAIEAVGNLAVNVEAVARDLFGLPPEKLTPKEREVVHDQVLSDTADAAAQALDVAVVGDAGIFQPSVPPAGPNAARALGGPPTPPQMDPGAVQAIPTSAILAQFDKSKPGEAEMIPRDEMMLRVLYGLAAGAAQTPSSFWGGPTPGRVIGGAGAGGLGALLEGRGEDRARLAANEEAFQEFNRQRTELQLELEKAEAERALAREKLLYENRMLQHEADLERWKQEQKRFHYTPDGYFIEDGRTGEIDYVPVMSPRRIEAKARRAAANRSSLEEFMVGFDRKLKGEEAGALAPFHTAATLVMFYGFAPELLAKAESDALAENEDLRARAERPSIGQSGSDIETTRAMVREAAYQNLMEYFTGSLQGTMAVLRAREGTLGVEGLQ